MLSQTLIKFLVLEYSIIMIVCLIEGNWRKATYWLGASVINIGVLLMK